MNSYYKLIVFETIAQELSFFEKRLENTSMLKVDSQGRVYGIIASSLEAGIGRCQSIEQAKIN